MLNFIFRILYDVYGIKYFDLLIKLIFIYLEEIISFINLIIYYFYFNDFKVYN